MAADRIITVSHWTRQIVVTRYGIPEGKIRVVHNGILPRNQSPGLPFPEIGSHLVTFLGRVTHQKGPAFFVEAAAKVLQEFENLLKPLGFVRIHRSHLVNQKHVTAIDDAGRVWLSDQTSAATLPYGGRSPAIPASSAPGEMAPR